MHQKIKQTIERMVFNMAVIYATLIVKGKKTISDVPAIIRNKVKEILIDLELPELAEETSAEA